MAEWPRTTMTDLFELNVDLDAEARALRIIEALLFTAAEPLDEARIAEKLPAGTNVRGLIERIAQDYAGRGIELKRLAGKWMFRTAEDLAPVLRDETVEVKKLTRAQLETLAIIAYHQPVTRAEMEEIRGVVTSKGTLDVLLDTGWIRMRGRRRTPGRPVTYGTTESFLIHFGLDQIQDLPGLDELKGAGLIDARLPPGFGVPLPSDNPALTPEEDPLEPNAVDEAEPLDDGEGVDDSEARDAQG